jgi:hypothetical protein
MLPTYLTFVTKLSAKSISSGAQYVTLPNISHMQLYLFTFYHIYLLDLCYAASAKSISSGAQYVTLQNISHMQLYLFTFYHI